MLKKSKLTAGQPAVLDFSSLTLCTQDNLKRVPDGSTAVEQVLEGKIHGCYGRVILVKIPHGITHLFFFCVWLVPILILQAHTLQETGTAWPVFQWLCGFPLPDCKGCFFKLK